MTVFATPLFTGGDDTVAVALGGFSPAGSVSLVIEPVSVVVAPLDAGTVTADAHGIVQVVPTTAGLPRGRYDPVLTDAAAGEVWRVPDVVR